MKGFLWFLLGLGGATLFGLGLHALADAFNPNLCRYRTISALIMPLVLGPGGIFLATRSIRHGDGRVPLGIGVVVASLVVLYLGLRIIGELKVQGCAPATLKTSLLERPVQTPPVALPSLERR